MCLRWNTLRTICTFRSLTNVEAKSSQMYQSLLGAISTNPTSLSWQTWFTSGYYSLHATQCVSTSSESTSTMRSNGIWWVHIPWTSIKELHRSTPWPTLCVEYTYEEFLVFIRIVAERTAFEWRGWYKQTLFRDRHFYHKKFTSRTNWRTIYSRSNGPLLVVTLQ